MSLLVVKDLKVSYGGIEALKGISFSVDIRAARGDRFCRAAGR